jgi:hypothetical protein
MTGPRAFGSRGFARWASLHTSSLVNVSKVLAVQMMHSLAQVFQAGSEELYTLLIASSLLASLKAGSS